MFQQPLNHASLHFLQASFAATTFANAVPPTARKILLRFSWQTNHHHPWITASIVRLDFGFHRVDTDESD